MSNCSHYYNLCLDGVNYQNCKLREVGCSAAAAIASQAAQLGYDVRREHACPYAYDTKIDARWRCPCYDRASDADSLPEKMESDVESGCPGCGQSSGHSLTCPYVQNLL